MNDERNKSQWGFKCELESRTTIAGGQSSNTTSCSHSWNRKIGTAASSCSEIIFTRDSTSNGFTGVNSRNNLFDEIDQTAFVAGGKRQNDDINPLGGESCLQRWQDLGGSFREGRDQDETGIFTHATEPNFGSSLPSA